MILDARDDTVDLDRSASVAIVGAGPAGMTLAHRLAGVAPVILIESGGFDPEDPPSPLLSGECVGIPYPLTETRARQFGGSSGLWAGYCAIFDDQDFLRREWIPLSGWPFGRAAVERYYAPAAEMLNLGQAEFDARDLAEHAGLELDLGSDVLVASAWRFGDPTRRFGDDLRGSFQTNANLTVLLSATVADIILHADGSRVRELVIRTLGGREGRVRADLVVLACGGLETPRLLLNCDRQIAGGIGNSTGMVGRCFMEHPHVTVASFAPDDSGWRKASMDCLSDDRGFRFLLAFGLKPEAQREAKVLNARAHLFRMSRDGSDVTRLGIMCEQAPNRASRLSLADCRDPFGMRRLRLDWRLGELDRRTQRETARRLVAAMARQGSPTRSTAEEAEVVEPGVAFCNHQIGTTRMAASREEGVVDLDCRVWDMSNLYIAGSSVFPTSGWANPTFMIVALTLRLADHLEKLLARRDSPDAHC